MNEYETDPQRPSANADADATPSYPTAELSPVERGPADSTPEATGPATPATAHGEPAPAGASDQAGTPTEQQTNPYADPTTGAPAGSAGATSGTTNPYAGPHQGTPVAPAGPYAGYPGQTDPYGRPYGATPQATPGHPGSAPNPYPPSPWHPAAQNQPGWTGNPSYAGQHAPGAHLPPQPPHLGGNPPPIWAQGPGAPGGAPRPSRLGKFAAIGAAALVLMAGSGIAGGAVALALDGSSGTTRTYTAAPIINSADLPKIAASVENSVVSITTGSGEGSGVVLTADGYVLTNNHVVASAGGDTVRVVFANGKTAQAKIIGTDPKTDLAVIKAQGVTDLSPAKFGDSDAMQVGDTVLALGSPLGLQGSVTAGILSARDRTIQASDEDQQQPQNPFQQQQPQQQAASSISGLLQTDAPINPGNSGGALINTKGEVIGINTAIATAGSNGNIGVGFAIPSNKAKDVAGKLQQGQKVSHPYLGVSVTESDEGGAVVGAVTEGSPAAQAGLQKGDVITRFGDKVVNDSNDLVGAVQTGKVGDKVQLTFTRNGAEQTATVTLAETS